MQIRRQRPRTAANGFEKQDEASEAFKDIIIKYNIINDMTRHKLSGAGAAIPTPFTPDGRVDYPALARTIDYIIDGGVDFIVALGTTQKPRPSTCTNGPWSPCSSKTTSQGACRW